MKRDTRVKIFLLLIFVIGLIVYRFSGVSESAQSESPLQASPNYYDQQKTETVIPEQNVESPEAKNVVPETQVSETEIKKDVLPEKIYLNVPFMVQAPGANWDAIHEEACEEASLIMLYHYIKNTAIGEPNKALDEVLQYENQHEYPISITLSQLNEITRSFYGLKNGRVEKNISIDDIKKELSAGKPVIVGAAGKILPNPNFRNGGPNYHMLVIIGYDKKGFITNDPGTRKGKDFRYTENALFNAIHDWNPQEILKGEKNYLVFD